MRWPKFVAPPSTARPCILCIVISSFAGFGSHTCLTIGQSAVTAFECGEKAVPYSRFSHTKSVRYRDGRAR